MKTIFVLRRKDTKIALLNSLHWEDLSNFLDRLKKLNPKEINKKDFEIVTILAHLAELKGAETAEVY